MVASHRIAITEVGGIGLGSLLLGTGTLNADDAKPQANPPASMIFETVFTEGVAELSYLIGDKATGKAAVIDPRRDIDVYVELARKYKLTITHALETHIHADMVSGCLELADRTGTAKVCVSAEGGAEYGFPHEKMKDGDKIDLGRVILTAKHTPGHTPEHLSYLAAERNRPDQPFAVFSGDCLFANSVGRPDLLGDDQSERTCQATLQLAARLLPEAAGRCAGSPGPRGRLPVRGEHQRPACHHHRVRAKEQPGPPIPGRGQIRRICPVHCPA